jgi:hypothetical protein
VIFIAKKVIKLKDKEFTFRHGLMFLSLVVLGALGFAALIQGILMQWSFGFKYGFVAYFFGFLFMGATKYMKWKLYSELKK